MDPNVVFMPDVHDEKVLRLDMYMSEAEALEAVGLSEQDAHADS